MSSQYLHFGLENNTPNVETSDNCSFNIQQKHTKKVSWIIHVIVNLKHLHSSRVWIAILGQPLINTKKKLD